MTNVPSTDTSDRSLARDILDAARYYIGGRRTLFVLAAVLIVGGIALNWGWLVAAGLAPILIALLPCAVMCALGLCMHKMVGGAHGGNRSSTANSAIDQDGEPAALVDPVSRRTVPAGPAIASVHRGRVYHFEDRANRDATLLRSIHIEIYVQPPRRRRDEYQSKFKIAASFYRPAAACGAGSGRPWRPRDGFRAVLWTASG